VTIRPICIPFDEYGLRFDLEENFLDDKSAGFNSSPAKSRCRGSLSPRADFGNCHHSYLVSTGCRRNAGLACLYRYPLQRGLSYFQIGWRYIRYALAHFKYLLPFFWLDPKPDPCPALASKRQAAIPIAALFALRLEVT
jgi:hypothetical protein